MYVEHRSSLLSRPGPLIAVIGVHVMIAYLLSISMGIVKVPKILEAIGERGSAGARERGSEEPSREGATASAVQATALPSTAGSVR